MSQKNVTWLGEDSSISGTIGILINNLGDLGRQSPLWMAACIKAKWYFSKCFACSFTSVELQLFRMLSLLSIPLHHPTLSYPTHHLQIPLLLVSLIHPSVLNKMSFPLRRNPLILQSTFLVSPLSPYCFIRFSILVLLINPEKCLFK